MCKAYVEELGKVSKSSLDAAGTRIVIVGCGEWSVIKEYKGESLGYVHFIYISLTRM
jgi:hypothetical protein